MIPTMNEKSPPTRGKFCLGDIENISYRNIPSNEGQIAHTQCRLWFCPKHPLLREADIHFMSLQMISPDSSPPARGRRMCRAVFNAACRFIPSCEGQTIYCFCLSSSSKIHPLLRGADFYIVFIPINPRDSSPPARGRHSVFMRLSAALNTSLCNLHKCHFQLVTHHFHYI